jgi:hypothetical protein
MNKINNNYTQEKREGTITYDDIMNKLTKHFIREEPTYEVNKTKPIQPIKNMSQQNRVYVENVIERPTLAKNGQLNNEKIDEQINMMMEREQNGELGIPNDINEKDRLTQYLLRNIAIHNNKVLKEKSRIAKTRMNFQ